MIEENFYDHTRKLLLNLMKEGVNNVLNGKIETYDNNFLSPNDFVTYLQEIGHSKYNFDCNGWDYDFWISYTINDKEYRIAGSGYYGTLSFFKQEE